MKTKSLSTENDWSEVDREIRNQAAMELVCGEQSKFNRRRIRTSAEIIAAILALLLIWLACGCKKTLEAAGPYHGDKFLYDADHVITETKGELSAFLSWELSNRKILWDKKLTNVTVIADSVRTNSPLWFTNAVNARNAYSNSVALSAGPGTISVASNALQGNLTSLQNQSLSAKALETSVNLK